MDVPLHRKKWQKWGIIIFNAYHVPFLRKLLEDVLHQKKGVNHGRGKQKSQHERVNGVSRMIMKGSLRVTTMMKAQLWSQSARQGVFTEKTTETNRLLAVFEHIETRFTVLSMDY